MHCLHVVVFQSGRYPCTFCHLRAATGWGQRGRGLKCPNASGDKTNVCRYKFTYCFCLDCSFSCRRWKSTIRNSTKKYTVWPGAVFRIELLWCITPQNFTWHRLNFVGLFLLLLFVFVFLCCRCCCCFRYLSYRCMQTEPLCVVWSGRRS